MKKRILITDDDEGIQEIYKIIFERAGYDVDAIIDAEPLMAGDFHLPDLILLDRQLSGYDGLTVCRYLKQQQATKDIPVIIISASPDIGALAQNAGADFYIEKPFEVKELLKTVEKFL